MASGPPRPPDCMQRWIDIRCPCLPSPRFILVAEPAPSPASHVHPQRHHTLWCEQIKVTPSVGVQPPQRMHRGGGGFLLLPSFAPINTSTWSLELSNAHAGKLASSGGAAMPLPPPPPAALTPTKASTTRRRAPGTHPRGSPSAAAAAPGAPPRPGQGGADGGGERSRGWGRQHAARPCARWAAASAGPATARSHHAHIITPLHAPSTVCHGSVIDH